MSQAQIALRLLALATLIIVVVMGVVHYRGLVKRAEQGDRAETAAKVTTGLVDDGQEADKQQEQTTVRVVVARETYHRELAEVERNEPEVADRADRVVPVSLRELACRRRLARTGLVGECAIGSKDAEPAIGP